MQPRSPANHGSWLKRRPTYARQAEEDVRCTQRAAARRSYAPVCVLFVGVALHDLQCAAVALGTSAVAHWTGVVFIVGLMLSGIAVAALPFMPTSLPHLARAFAATTATLLLGSLVALAPFVVCLGAEHGTDPGAARSGGVPAYLAFIAVAPFVSLPSAFVVAPLVCVEWAVLVTTKCGTISSLYAALMAFGMCAITIATRVSMARAEVEDAERRAEKLRRGAPMPSRSASVDMKALHHQAGVLLIREDELSVQERVGAGAYGDVFRAKWHGKDVAVKVMFASPSWTETQRKHHETAFITEIKAMAMLRHPNVTLFMGACQTPKQLSIVTEFVSRGSMWDVLHKPSLRLSLDLRRAMAVDAALGMTYLHHRGFCHGDLKTPNLLVTSNYHVKVADFSMARWEAKSTKAQAVSRRTVEQGVGAGQEDDGVAGGSLLWTAPEVFRGESAHPKKCDAYAFGICLWELLTRQVPHADLLAEPAALQMRIMEGLRPPCSASGVDLPPEWEELMSRCWDANPAARPSFDEILTALRSATFLRRPAGISLLSRRSTVLRARRTHSGHYSVSSDEGATSDSSGGSVGRAMFGIHDVQPVGIAAQMATAQGLAEGSGRQRQAVMGPSLGLKHEAPGVGSNADAAGDASDGAKAGGDAATADGAATDSGAAVTADDVELRMTAHGGAVSNDRGRRSGRTRHSNRATASSARMRAPSGVQAGGGGSSGFSDAGTGSTGAVSRGTSHSSLAALVAEERKQSASDSPVPFAGTLSSATGVAGLTFKVGGAPSPMRGPTLASSGAPVMPPPPASLSRSSSRRGRRSAPSFGRFRQSQSLESTASAHGPMAHGGVPGADAPPGPESDANGRGTPTGRALAAAFSVGGSLTASVDTDNNSTSSGRSGGSMDSGDSDYSTHSSRFRRRQRRRRERARGDSVRSRDHRDGSARMRYGMARSLSLKRSSTGTRSMEGSVGTGDGWADRDDRYDRHHGALRTSRSRDSGGGGGSVGTGSVGGSIGHWECGPELLEWLLDPLDITVLDRIAGGSSGAVYRGTYMGADVAIKTLSTNPDMMEKATAMLAAETKAIGNINHPNIVELIGILLDPPLTCVVLELMSRGNLTNVLQDSALVMDWPARLSIALDIARGMQCLHSRNVIHRDLKSMNLLLNHEWTCKVADFGFARLKAANVTLTRVGTPAWVAPEVMLGQRYSEKVDIYSYGIVLWELLTREYPYQAHADTLGLMRRVVREGYRPPLPPLPSASAADERSPYRLQFQFQDMIATCWGTEPASRPSFNVICAFLDLLVSNLRDADGKPIVAPPPNLVLSPPPAPVTGGAGATKDGGAGASGKPAASTGAPAAAAKPST